MKTITRTTELAELDEINPKFNAEKFEAMLANDDPDEGTDHTDGKPEFCSWYHLCNDVSHCTTIFYSDRLPLGEKGDDPGELVASGRYLGEPGEWRLYKQGSAGKAPYEQ